ncbi:MAG: alpha/beta fold hydrolase [Myxococcota bacterium]
MAPPKHPEVDVQRIRADDGTELTLRSTGRGPTALLCAGLGGSWRAWSHQVAYLGDRLRFVSWDPRGFYDSSPPADANAVGVAQHARDALAVLDAAEAERALLFGWSMGVPVALELFRRAPERVAGLVLVAGTADGARFGLGARFPWVAERGGLLARLTSPWMQRLGDAAWLLESLTRRIADAPEAQRWAQRLGLVSRDLDEASFDAVAQDLKAVDLRTWVRTFEALRRHDARDVLPEIDVPTLVLAGGRDAFVPASEAARLADAIPGAERMVVPEATHFVALEAPELVNLRVEKFLRERGASLRDVGSELDT